MKAAIPISLTISRLMCGCKRKLGGTSLNWYYLWVIALTALFGFVKFLYFNLPVIVNDEYSYWATGVNRSDLEGLYLRDPALPRASAVLYLALIQLIDAIGGGKDFVRAMNFLLWAATSGIVYLISRQIIDSTGALVSALIWLVMPFSLYGVTLMAEPMYVFVSYVSICFFLHFIIYERLATLIMAASTCALAALVKPHAFALFLACLIVLVCSKKYSKASVYFIPGFFITFFGVGSLLSGGVVFDMAPLVGSIYTDIASGILSGIGHSAAGAQDSLNYVLGISRYFFSNLATLVVVFPMGMISSLVFALPRCYGDRLRELVFLPQDHHVVDRVMWVARTIFVIILAYIAMTSVFTSFVGEKNVFETNRLHGRYFNHFFPLLMALSLFSASRLTPIAIRAFSFIWLLVLLYFFLVITDSFKIYPWDNPDIFGFYRVSDASTWGFNPFGSLFWLAGLITGCFLSIALWIAPQLRRQGILILWVLIVVAFGNVQTLTWAMSNHRGYSATVEDVKALRQIALEVGEESRGLVAGEDRYGRLATVLHQFNGKVHVREVSDSAMSLNDVPADISWMLTPRAVKLYDDLKGRVRQSVILGEYELSLFERSGLISESRPTRLCTEKIKLDFRGGAKNLDFALVGFNAPEDWGVWTREQQASIALSCLLRGSFVLRLLGYSDPSRKEYPTVLSVGGVSHSVLFGYPPRWVEVSFQNPAASSEIGLQTLPYQENQWARPIGTAIIEAEITFAADQPSN
jgi:hypothetical protein